MVKLYPKYHLKIYNAIFHQIIRKAAGESRYYWGYSHVREYDAIDNVYSDTIGFVYEGIFEDDEYSRID